MHSHKVHIVSRSADKSAFSGGYLGGWPDDVFCLQASAMGVSDGSGRVGAARLGEVCAAQPGYWKLERGSEMPRNVSGMFLNAHVVCIQAEACRCHTLRLS